MKEVIQLKPGDLIRTRYKGEWEYSIMETAESASILGSEFDLEQWKKGKPIEPLIYCKNEELQKKVRLAKEHLRDGAEVIQCVWKGKRLTPRKRIKPK